MLKCFEVRKRLYLVMPGDYRISSTTEDKEKQGQDMLLPRQYPQSVHEARVVNTSVRIECGRYKVNPPPIFPRTHSPVQPVCNSRYMASDLRPRRPIKAAGDGQLLGKHVVPETSFAKIVEVLPSRSRKRVYFDDEFDPLVEEPEMPSGGPKKVRVIKRFQMRPYKKYEDGGMPGPSLMKSHHEGEDLIHEHHLEEDLGREEGKSPEGMDRMPANGQHPGGDMDRQSPDRLTSGHSGQHPGMDRLPGGHQGDEEQDQYGQGQGEVVDVIEEEENESGMGGYMGGYPGGSQVTVPRFNSISIGNVALVKQLRGENNYLKDQLDASFYRIKQLEALLLERNQRLRQLLTENVQLGVKVRKLTADIGVDEAAERLGRP